ncbi:hypothetical protein ADUPG1_002971, partial [Aduncisulcus paluster]
TAKTGDGIAGEIPKDKKKTGKGKPDGTGDAGHEDLLVDGDHSGSGSTFSVGLSNNLLTRGDLGPTAIFSESGVRKKVLPVLKDTKVQPPRGNYVYQLRVPHRSEIMEFCHSVIDLVKSDTNLVLPSIGTLVEDSVLLILKTLTQLEIDETCGDHDYVKSVLEKVVGAYTSGSLFEEFVKEARDVVCECHTVDGHGEPVLDLVADYVCAMEKLTKRSGRDAWN